MCFRIIILLSMVCVVIGGCSQSDSRLSLYLRDTTIMVEHHQYFVDFTLANKDRKDDLTLKLIKYLNGEATCDVSLPVDMQLKPSLSSRLFWALVLARLTDRPLEIYTSDDEKLREEKISTLLKGCTVGGNNPIQPASQPKTDGNAGQER